MVSDVETLLEASETKTKAARPKKQRRPIGPGILRALEVPQVDEAKVEFLRQAIRAGTYTADAKAIIQALLHDTCT